MSRKEKSSLIWLLTLASPSEIVNTADGIEVDNIGAYNPSSGRIDLVGFNPTAVEGDVIKISSKPANQSTIRPLRATVLDIDTMRRNSCMLYIHTYIILLGELYCEEL